MSGTQTIGQGGDTLCSMSRNWWAFVLRGVLALVFGGTRLSDAGRGTAGADPGLRRLFAG
ncbi:hypothetical protein [Corynebacterium flavescens]|uniref:hypothetical protein n=1 Tax=Corynebacterium flavescens TaxID=28028 RepID=UPI0023F4EAC3